MPSTSIYTGIYLILSPSNKIYIGQSVDIDKRWKKYANLNCSDQPKLYNSLKKHGPENHTFEIIHHCLAEDLNHWERHYQDEYDVLGKKGLNCFLTKTDDKSGLFCQETKDKLSKSHIGLKHTEKTKKKMSDNHPDFSGENNPYYGKHPEQSGKDNPNFKGYIQQYTLDGVFVKESTIGVFITEGFMPSNIYYCINHPNDCPKYKGYRWSRI